MILSVGAFILMLAVLTAVLAVLRFKNAPSSLVKATEELDVAFINGKVEMAELTLATK